jgi:uncharacterized protein
MFSFSKLLVLAAVIGAVWYGFKYVSRLQYQREKTAEARDRVERRRDGEPVDTPKGREKAQDMVQCSACMAYVAPKGARNCGRPDCPY